MTLRINRIQRFCLHDGPGIRSVVFLQGCHLHCPWCHNPETWPAAGGSADQGLLEFLLREGPWWKRSGGGVTISGGEPLDQAEALAPLLDRLGAAGVHRAIESSGDGPDGAEEILRSHSDLWLLDLKHADASLLERRSGVRLARVLATFDHLLAAGARVVARIPLIGGFNDDADAVAGLAALCAERPALAGIEVLPGHDHAKAGRPVSARGDPARLDVALAMFSATGLPTRIIR